MSQSTLRIDPKWETRLRPQYVVVVQLLSPSRHHLTSRLYSKHLLTASEEEEFNKLSKYKSEEEVAKEILGVLRKQSVGSFDRFCEVLSDVGDPTLNDLVTRLRQDSFENVSSHQTGIGVPSASSGVSSTAGETDTTDGNNKLTPFLPVLHSQGWKYDVFLCHAGEDKEDFVSLLSKELKEKHKIVSFFDKVSLLEGRVAQTDIAEAIRQSPLFVVILSHKFKGKRYPEAEVKAAFEFCKVESDPLRFDSRYKKIIPVFYKIRADDCGESSITILRELSQITGIEKETDENVTGFVTRVAERIRKHVEDQRDYGEIKVHPELSSGRILATIVAHCTEREPADSSVSTLTSGVCQQLQVSNLDGELSSQLLVKVAGEVSHRWQEFGARLSANMFPTKRTDVITVKYREPFVRAQAMLEEWREAMGRRATCDLIVQTLLKMGLRKEACDIFGYDVVELIYPNK